MRTGVKINLTTFSPVEKTAWLWSPMRTANGTTFPATTICPMSARKEQVRKGTKRKNEKSAVRSEMCELAKRAWEELSWGCRHSEKTQRGMTLLRLLTLAWPSRKVLRHLVLFSILSSEMEASLKVISLCHKVLQVSIFRRKVPFFFLPSLKFRKAGVLLCLLLPFTEVGSSFSPESTLELLFTLDLHTGQTVGRKQGNRCIQSRKRRYTW